MILRLPIAWLRATAITVWPFVIVDPSVTGGALERVLRHEAVHLRQQRQWASYGLSGAPVWVTGFLYGGHELTAEWVLAAVLVLLSGLLLWFALYLLALPVWWNPWRRHWEAEAMREADGLSEDEITRRLRLPPYYLWSL